jgi:hypothetical protein
MSGSNGFNRQRHDRQTQTRLVVIGFAILLFLGGGLVLLLYGPGAALTAVACILAFAGILGLLWLLLSALEKWVKDDGQ